MQTMMMQVKPNEFEFYEHTINPFIDDECDCNDRCKKCSKKKKNRMFGPIQWSGDIHTGKMQPSGGWQ